MDFNDVELKVKAWLIANGKDGFSITTYMHTTGTNVHTAIAKKDNITITFTLNDDTGEITSAKESTLYVRQITEVNIPVTDHISTSNALYFELTEPITIPQIKQNSSDIELIFDTDDQSKLLAFRIKVLNFNPVDTAIAFQKAYRLTNFISWKYGAYIFHKRPRQSINGQIGSISFPVDVVLSALLNLDLQNTSLSNLINTSSKDNQRLAHLTNGQRALEDANFSEAIREFYQVIETEVEAEIRTANTFPNVAHLINYKYLRHGVNHVELRDPTTIGILRSVFHLTLISNQHTSMEYLDPSDISNEKILEKEAINLRKEVYQFLNSEIRI